MLFSENFVLFSEKCCVVLRTFCVVLRKFLFCSPNFLCCSPNFCVVLRKILCCSPHFLCCSPKIFVLFSELFVLFYVLFVCLFLCSWFRASSLYMNKIQLDATDAGIYHCKLTLHVSGVYRTPSSGVHQTVTAASGKVISRIRATTFCQRGLIRPR